jgi:hypothetical protein
MEELPSLDIVCTGRLPVTKYIWPDTLKYDTWTTLQSVNDCRVHTSPEASLIAFTPTVRSIMQCIILPCT